MLGYVFRIRLTIKFDLDSVSNSRWIVSVTSRWQASDGSHIEEGWGHHSTCEVKCISGRFEKMQCSYKHFLIVLNPNF
ncbi:hypothetical protein QL285_010244 [Trifolium repens]|nr:hypothetical protein QL285_010244 [Trifolium repens]